MSESERSFLGRLDSNYEKLVKERKNAKIMIVLASIGAVSGFTASLVFFLMYDFYITPAFALFTSNYIFE